MLNSDLNCRLMTFCLLWSANIWQALFHSASDIVSDYLLLNDYMAGESFTKTVTDINDPIVKNLTAPNLADAVTRTCVLTSSDASSFTFTCNERPLEFGILTLIFIYLPTLNIFSALFGLISSGFLGIFWGSFMIIFGWTLWHFCDAAGDVAGASVGFFCGLFGIGFLFIGFLLGIDHLINLL